jgi:hypothetical protein
LNHTHLFIVAIPLFLLGPHIIKFLHHLGCDRAIFGSRLQEIDLAVQSKDEQMVGNYWNLIPSHKQLRWFTKEVYLQKALKIRTQDYTSMQKLKK